MSQAPKSTYRDYVMNDYSGPIPNVLPGGYVVVPPEPVNVPNFIAWHVVTAGEFIAIFPYWKLAKDSAFGWPNNHHEKCGRWPNAFMMRWNLVEIPGVVGIAMTNGPLVPSGPPLPAPVNNLNTPAAAQPAPAVPGVVGNAPAAPVVATPSGPTVVTAPAPVVTTPTPVATVSTATVTHGATSTVTGTPTATQAVTTKVPTNTKGKEVASTSSVFSSSSKVVQKATDDDTNDDPPPRNRASKTNYTGGISAMDWYPVSDSDVEAPRASSSSKAVVSTGPVIDEGGTITVVCRHNPYAKSWPVLHKDIKAYFGTHASYTGITLLRAIRAWDKVKGDSEDFLDELLRLRVPTPAVDFAEWCLSPDYYESDY